MNTDEKNKYFQELSRNLRHEGLIVKTETEEGLLPVELDGQRLCLVLDTGAVRYWKEDVADDHRSAALNRVTDVAKITAEYMRQMEAAPQLTASGLTGDYRLLAEFNDTVLAGHPSKYGVQFITWEWVRDHTALYQGTESMVSQRSDIYFDEQVWERVENIYNYYKDRDVLNRRFYYNLPTES